MILLIIYFVLALRKCIIDKRQSKDKSTAKQYEFHQDYEHFKKLKMLELSDLERRQQLQES